MNEDGIFEVCEALGLRSSAPHGGSRGPNLSISCPLAPKRHGDPVDYNLSCSVSISDNEPSLAKCFSLNCNFKGSFFRMLEEAADIRGRPAALMALLKKIEPTERFTLASSLARSKSRFDASIDALRNPRPPTKDRDIMDEARLDRYKSEVPRYALKRGITLESCKEWELGYDKDGGRLVFPVRRFDGKLVGLTGRILPSAEKKAKEEGRTVTRYHNYAGFDKARYLYGEHRLKDGEPLIICEGQIDAILTRQNLGVSAVAPLGEGFSSDHVKTICAFSPPVVYLFPDNDSAGYLTAEKIEYALHGRVSMRIMLPPAGKKDPGDLTQEEAKAAFAAARPILGRIRWDEF